MLYNASRSHDLFYMLVTVWLSTSCCILRMYVELTSFHAAMYFSMHNLRHVCSLLEREEPGLGTQRSKHFSLMFWGRVSVMWFGNPHWKTEMGRDADLDQGPRISHVGL